MPLYEFLKRFLVHASLALSFWYAALLALERLIPGFVSPFVDLAQTGLVALACLGLTLLIVRRGMQKWPLALAAIAYFLLAAASLSFLYSRVNNLSVWGMGLCGIAVLLFILSLYILCIERVAE